MLRRSIVVLLASLVMLAMAVPALAQYPPVPTTTTTVPTTTTTTMPPTAPTCALVAEVLEVPGFLSLQGTQWQPNSTVVIEIAGIFYEVQTDAEGNFREDLFVNQEDVLAFLGDNIDLTQTLELEVVCRGTDQAGEPHEVLLLVEVQFPLLNGEIEGVTCYGWIELVNLEPLLTWRGEGWEPGSTVVVTPALVSWEAVVDPDGTFEEQVVIAEEELVNLFDAATAGLLECQGFGTDGTPQTVSMTLIFEPTLLESLGLDGLVDSPVDDGGGNGILDAAGSLLGTSEDAVIQLPPLNASLLSGQAQPVDWDPQTNGAAFVALLAMFLMAIGGVDFLVWSRRRNDTTLPDGQNL